MIRVVAFFLSLLIYSAILFFLYSILEVKSQKKPEVLIHTAIIPKKEIKPKQIAIKKQVVKKQIEKSNEPNKKLKSKTDFTKGGKDIKLDDIFKNVNYNIKTEKIKQKASIDMSRLKGVEKALNKIENLKIDVTIHSNNKKKVDVNKITEKLGEVWDKISSNSGEYAIIRVISANGVQAFVLDTNLNKEMENELITQIESLEFKEKFDITVKFQTKGN